MTVQRIGRPQTTLVGRLFGRKVQTPQMPKELVALREAARVNHPKHSWTGVNLIHKNSGADVQRHLGDTRDASRTLVSSNADMFVMRHSYKTGESMHAFLESKPKNNVLKLQVAITPSWHANAPDSWTVTGALKKIEPSKLTALDVVEALRGSARFSETLELELEHPVERLGQHLFEDIKARLTGDVEADKKMVTVMVQDLGQTAMGQKFSRENVYQVVVKTPDGKSQTKVFDVSGKESDKSTRYAKAFHASLSPEISIDLSAFAGQDIIVEAYPHGSAGVGGYSEARRTVIHVPNAN